MFEKSPLRPTNELRTSSFQTRQRIHCPSSYLPNPVDLLLICLSDVEDAGVRQGDRCGALQGRVYGQLTETVVDAWHLAMHGSARDDAHLRSKAENMAALAKRRLVQMNL